VTARGGTDRLEDLTLDELDELRDLVGGADPTDGDFWSNLRAIYGFTWLIERRSDPSLTWDAVRAWPLREVYAALAEVPEPDPTGNPGSGNGAGSPTPMGSPRERLEV
jgi:hypothetical protein